MTGLGLLVLAVAGVAAVALVPGWAIARALGLPGRLALATAPAASAGVLGIGAVLCAMVGVRWEPSSALVFVLACVGVALAVRVVGSRLPAAGPIPDLPPLSGGRPWTLGIVAVGVAVAVLPVAAAFGRPDGMLQRWDSLFHLSAVQWVRTTGDGSTLHLGAVAALHGQPAFYPAAFHDMAALVPVVPVPILLNAASATLTVLPWVLGTMLLARVLWTRVRWAPVAAGTLAALAPASPLDLWIHLSPTPNAVGFAMMPSVLALGILVMRRLRRRDMPLASRGTVLLILAWSAGTAGLALMHPNVLVMLLLLSAAGAATDLISHRDRSRLRGLSVAAVPVVVLLPVVAIVLLPGSSFASTFTGGLVVSGEQAIGEIALGLLTVWPMALGVGIWALMYLGIWAQARRGQFVMLSWLVVVVVLYADSAVDSSLNLSALWYRGQDRISLPFSMVAVLLAVAGAAHLLRWASVPSASPSRRLTVPVAIGLIAVLVGLSVPVRYENARLNAALDEPGRPRYFDTEEYDMLVDVAPTLDPTLTVLANPFSGGAHLYGMTGQPVRYLSAGVHPDTAESALMDAALRADRDPAACRLLEDNRIGYVYVDDRAYYRGGSFSRVDEVPSSLGTVIARTSHSRLLEVHCSTR